MNGSDGPEIDRVGIGLRSPHIAQIIAARPKLGFIEVHAENYMAEPRALDVLLDLRRDYPVSIHGVALSLGSAEPLDQDHLRRLKALAECVEPILVSEHLAWNAIRGAYLNDLLPLPYTEATLDLFCRHVDEAQETLGRRLLVENPSSYFRYRQSRIPEAEFIVETARRTGCGILCDVNNIYVSARNLGFDPIAYIATLPREAVGEIHLAGHHTAEAVDILIDDHGSPVASPVWDLYIAALGRFGPAPTLVEWDTNIPPLEVLIDEARRAEELVEMSAALLALRDLQMRLRQAVLRGDAGDFTADILDDGLDPAARVGIHRNHALTTFGDALRRIFPVVCRLVDERFFAYAVHEYLRGFPPRSRCLAEFGGDFPGFLAHFSPLQDWPYMADVARLEWALSRAASERQATPLPVGILADIPADDAAHVVLHLQPSLSYLSSPWPIDAIWQANQIDEVLVVDLTSGGVSLEVRRQGEAVEWQRLAGEIFAFREALAIGQGLTATLMAAISRDPAFDLAAALRAVFAEGLVVGVAASTARPSLNE